MRDFGLETVVLDLPPLVGAFSRRLRDAGLTPVRNLVGSYITSLEMAGASLTVLDDSRLGSAQLAETQRALREEVLAASAQVTGPMLATIDRAELDTTIRTLEKITRLARETSDTEGNR